MVKPANPNHRWFKDNGSTVVQLIRQANSPPSNNPLYLKEAVQATETSAAGTGTALGYVFWCWEGPANSEDLASVGEIEVYVDALFEGLNA
jgi:hypothetical protein